MRRDSFARSRLSGAGVFPDAVTRVIDDERRQQFMQEGAHYETEYFLTLTYLPPLEAEENEGLDVRRHGPQSASGRGANSRTLQIEWTCSKTFSALCSRPNA